MRTDRLIDEAIVVVAHKICCATIRAKKIKTIDMVVLWPPGIEAAHRGEVVEGTEALLKMLVFWESKIEATEQGLHAVLKSTEPANKRSRRRSECVKTSTRSGTKRG